MGLVLSNADARIRLEELPSKRTLVRVESPGATYIHTASCETSYPTALIEAILQVKGPAFLCDEILRDESASYVQLTLKYGILGYIPPEEFEGKSILDFGCGCGASTVILARMFPYTRIVGVDIDGRLLSVAETRAHFHGFDHVTFVRCEKEDQLPSDIGEFDFLVLSAVYEHFLPLERKPLLGHIWSALRVGGILFINQTPYRYWPIETHTTGLPFINYLPDRVTLALARRFSKRVARDERWDVLLRKGIRGATEQEILGNLRGKFFKPKLLEPQRLGLRDRIDLWHEEPSLARLGKARRLVKLALKALKKVSGVTIVPSLSLAIRKDRGVEG